MRYPGSRAGLVAVPPASKASESRDNRTRMAVDNFTSVYSSDGWDRARIDALHGITMLEFGTAWCSICQAAQPLIRTVVNEGPELRHVKVEDGKGRPLGRSYGVKLWPTLIVLKDGKELGRVVRPDSPAELRSLFSHAV
jgi:thioredoxin 1